MASVFIPAAFLPGTTGQLYKQFAITIVISVALSGFVALTLTPAMCGFLLRHNPPPQKGFFAWFNRQVDRITVAFGDLVLLIIKHMKQAFLVLACLMALLVLLFKVLPTSFVPNEDQGYVLSAVFMPGSASLNRTAEVGEKVDAHFCKKSRRWRAAREINGYSLLDGQYKTNASTFFVKLKDFKERYGSWATAKAAERQSSAAGGCRAVARYTAGQAHTHCAAGDSGHRHHGRL